MLISDLIYKGSNKLKKENISSHLLDSELILSNLLNKTRESLLVLDEKILSKKYIDRFNLLIRRRKKKSLLRI